MEEIDTKPIQAVQAAISFLDHVKTGFSKNQELGKERELDNLIKDLETVKLELEANDCAYKQALIKLDCHQKTAGELSNLLRKCDSRKLFYINECQESSARMSELESALKRMAHQVKESEKVQEQLLQVVSERVSAQDQLTNTEAQVATMQETVSRAVATESILSEEKQKLEVLTRRISEMNEITVAMKKRVLEIEREKAAAVAEKVAELETAMKATEEAEKKLESMHSLEDQLLDKTAVINSLQMELNQVNEQHASSQKALSDAICEMKKLEENLELQEKNNQDQADRIRLLEVELKQSRTELGYAHTEANCLNEHLEKMKSELETEQVEIALLKFELHKGKSKLAAAEARAKGEKPVPTNQVGPTGEVFTVDTLGENGREVENMKKELELAMVKIGQLRTRAAQAISRAEAAEKAKAVMEEQMKRLKGHNVVALDGESSSTDAVTVLSVKGGIGDGSSYQPLAKVLDMKF